jgi:hypothetical protein
VDALLSLGQVEVPVVVQVAIAGNLIAAALVDQASRLNDMLSDGGSHWDHHNQATLGPGASGEHDDPGTR